MALALTERMQPQNVFYDEDIQTTNVLSGHRWFHMELVVIVYVVCDK